jgi:hypothetical protein
LSHAPKYLKRLLRVWRRFTLVSQLRRTEKQFVQQHLTRQWNISLEKDTFVYMGTTFMRAEVAIVA